MKYYSFFSLILIAIFYSCADHTKAGKETVKNDSPGMAAVETKSIDSSS